MMSDNKFELLDEPFGVVYAALRRAFISAAAHEGQLEVDLAVSDAAVGTCRDPVMSTYARVALASTAAAFDALVEQIDHFERLIPRAVLNDIEVLRRNIARVLPDSSREIGAALGDLASAGSAGAWLARLKREAAGRRELYRLGPLLLDGGRAHLSDLFRLRDAVLATSPRPLIEELRADVEPPEPQPFILLCAFGPPGARVVCVIALAIAIAGSSHDVKD